MREYLKPISLGVVGVLLGLAGWHLYIDHVNLHALVALVQRQQQSQSTRPTPAPVETPK